MGDTGRVACIRMNPPPPPPRAALAVYTQPPLLAGPNPGYAVACWIPGAPSEQARNRPPLGQRVVFPSTSGLRKLPACLSQRCQRGGGALSDWGAASAGVPCVPRHRPPALRRESESSPHIHPGDPTFTLVLSPAGKTLSPAPSEEDRVPREMSRSALLQCAKRTMCQRRG